MKELDVLLERYVESYLRTASHEQRQLLARLLELPDPILADYLFGELVCPPPGMGRLIAGLRGYSVQPAAAD